MTTLSAEKGIQPPIVDVDPFSVEVLEDPYPFYASLRELGPVLRNSRYNTYILPRHPEVVAAQNDWKGFTTTGGIGLSDVRAAGAWRPAGPLLEVDPPNHTEVRSVMSRIISPVVVRSWKEAFEREGALLADRILECGNFDGVRDVAEAFVLAVFPSALGVEIRRDQAVAVGDLNFNSKGPQNQIFRASQAAVEPYLDWWQRSMRRDSMVAGGFGEKIFMAEEAGEFKPGTAPGLIMSFLRGGMDTTIAAIGNALWLLARHPDQWRLLHENPDRTRALFEETIRFESPSQTNFRTTTQDMTFAGFQLERNTKVQLLLGSANRDPGKWPEPDRFDVTRSVMGHVALGGGVHNCIGQMIARLEFESVIKPLVSKARQLELSGSPQRRLNNTLRTLQTLPLRVLPA